jgi:hypothetical protein
MVAVGRFGIAADGRPIRLRHRAFDVLVALIEASGVMVGWSARTRSQAASGKAGSSIRTGKPGTTFRANRADRHDHIRRASIDAGAGSP